MLTKTCFESFRKFPEERFKQRSFKQFDHSNPPNPPHNCTETDSTAKISRKCSENF